MKEPPRLTILVAPLDWGLGHATRCVPLIQQLAEAKCRIYVACNATAKIVLQQEKIDVEYLPLDGYNIRYTSKRWMAVKILQQIPKIIRAVKKENRWLQSAIKKYRFDIVFSDNRYGLYNKNITSIFITHQLRIKAPYRWAEFFLQKINYRFINRFTECWVPDYEGELNIAGALSHPVCLPAKGAKYIGPLSRLKKINNAVIRYKWLIVLSGPEPQRTMLESLLVKAFSTLGEKFFLVRGLPAEAAQLSVPANCTVANHLPSTQLEQAFAQSKYIICRSGYTTVMEILALQKKAVLIPTPGQTEQEYLGKHLLQQQWCYSFQQHKNILFHLQQAQTFQYCLPQLPVTTLQTITENLLQQHS